MSYTPKTVPVLLQNRWATPRGRYERSVEGIPTQVPEAVLNLFPLPSTAKIVGDDYLPPAQQRGRDEEGMTKARIDAMVENAMKMKMKEFDARVEAAVQERLAKAEGNGAPENSEGDPDEEDVSDDDVDDTADDDTDGDADPADDDDLDDDHVPDDAGDAGPSGDGADALPNMADVTIRSVRKQFQNASPETLERALAEERAGKNRNGIISRLTEMQQG